MLTKGQVFEVNGKEFIFISTMRGVTKAFKPSNGTIVRFRVNFNDPKHSGAITILDEKRLDLIEELQEKLENLEDRARLFKKGDKFIGENNNTYTFIEWKKTRFVAIDNQGNEYSMKSAFIKNILEEN